MRFLKALSNESVRRLPYVFLIFIILLFIQFIRFNHQTAENTRIGRNNSTDTKTLLLRVKSLSEDNRRLTQQNIDLAKENATHLDCITKLFVTFLNGGLKPSQVDAARCTIESQASVKRSGTLNSAASPQSSQDLSVGPSSSTQSGPNPQPAQPNIVQPPGTATPAQKGVDFLHSLDRGIPIVKSVL